MTEQTSIEQQLPEGYTVFRKMSRWIIVSPTGSREAVENAAQVPYAIVKLQHRVPTTTTTQTTTPTVAQAQTTTRTPGRCNGQHGDVDNDGRCYTCGGYVRSYDAGRTIRSYNRGL